MNIFKYLNYKKYIKDFVETAKIVHKKYTFSQLAEALGVQKTYVSKVVNGDAHLSSDQVFSLARHFKMSEEEEAYLQLLVEYARTGLATRKKVIKARITSMQQRHRQTDKYVNVELVQQNEQHMSTYYLNPTMLIVHSLLFIPEYQKDYPQIARQLDLPLAVFQQIIKDLEKIGLIKVISAKQAVTIKNSFLQLSPQHPICTPHQNLMRMKSIDQLSKLTNPQKFCFSTTFTSRAETRDEIQEAFLQFLKQTEHKVRDSQPERCYQMNFDLFPWEHWREESGT